MRVGGGSVHAGRMQPDHDTRADAAPSTVRRLGIATLWFLAVLATAINGVVVGYGVLWLQFFGDSPDAADYRLSAAGYGTAAVVLGVAVPALLVSTAPRWLVPATGAAAAVLGMLALGSADAAPGAEPATLGGDDPWGDVLDGVGGVLWAPWTWVLLVLGVRGLALLAARQRRRFSDAR